MRYKWSSNVCSSDLEREVPLSKSGVTRQEQGVSAPCCCIVPLGKRSASRQERGVSARAGCLGTVLLYCVSRQDECLKVIAGGRRRIRQYRDRVAVFILEERRVGAGSRFRL